MTMRQILLPLVALAAWTFAPAGLAAADEPPGPGMERMQHWAADHEALLDAGLAGLKAGLKLTSDQDKLWPPFEAAVRDAAKLHMDQMKSMMERMQKMREMMTQGAPHEAISPVDRLEALAQRLSEHAAAIKAVADAAKPLYASLDDSQKRRFALLGRELIMMEHGRHGMEMMHGRMGMMGEGAMGREGGDPGRMERMGHGADDEEDNSDDE